MNWESVRPPSITTPDVTAKVGASTSVVKYREKPEKLITQQGDPRSP